MKQPGKALKTGPACQPFRDHLAAVRALSQPPTTWRQVESGFLEAMSLFDAEVMAGRASEGERQNGKGDYFNDLVAFLLENASGQMVSTRRGVSGLIFPNHNLDVTYPNSGIAELLVEAKMLGTPKHPGSGQADPHGRHGSADLLKRGKELGFKAIDLKAGFSKVRQEVGEVGQSGPAGDLETWSHASKPKTYFLMAVRVVNEADYRSVIETSANMKKILDGVGLFAYTNDHLDSSPKHYVEAKYKGTTLNTGLSLPDVLHQISNVLAGFKTPPTP